MIRRLILFVLCPLVLSYGVALLAVTLGFSTAGLHWLALVFYYLLFGLPGLAVATSLEHRKRRDLVELIGLVTGIGVGVFVWVTLGYVLQTSVDHDYAFSEAAMIGLLDAALNAGMAGLTVGLVLIGDTLLKSFLPKPKGGSANSR